MAVIPFTAYTAFNAKEGLLNIIYPKIKKDSTKMHFTLSSFVIITTVITSLFIDDIVTVFKWVGAGTCGSINLTFPCIFYLNTYKNTKMTIRKFLAYCIILISISFTVVSICVFTYETIN